MCDLEKNNSFMKRICPVQSLIPEFSNRTKSEICESSYRNILKCTPIFYSTRKKMAQEKRNESSMWLQRLFTRRARTRDSAKKTFCRAESALFMWIYIVFKQRENKHAQKKSSSTIQFRLRAGFSEWVHGVALSRRMTSQFSPLVLSEEDSCDIARQNQSRFSDFLILTCLIFAANFYVTFNESSYL